MSINNKIKEDIENNANYAEATQPIHKMPKLKFSEVQDIIKHNQHKKKINELMYDIPDSYANIHRFNRVLNDKNYELERRRREEYAILIRELDDMVKNVDNMNVEDSRMQRELIREQRDLIYQVSRIHKREREREHEQERERYYEHRRDCEFNAEIENLETQLLNNYLYPFYHLRNDRENIDEDVKARLASCSSKIVLLRR